jgi:hypothetical protein
MTLDQRLAQAVHHVADGVAVPDVDLDAVRTRARANRLRMVAAAATVAVVAATVAGTAIVGGSDTNSPIPPSSTTSPSGLETGSASLQDDLDTSTWQTYRSTQYGFTIGHPPNWSESPATRDWEWERDGLEASTTGQENFLNQYGDVQASAWSAPFERGTRMDSTADLVDWVENYCERSGIGPCTGIADRGVELCVEARDCHPGLLVPFEEDVQAFFSGGLYSSEKMTVVAVWRSESHPTVEPYGGAQRILEAYLSTMQVWPRSTPLDQRR